MATTYKTEDGNGSKLIFTYPFPALKTEDVQVALNGGVQAATKYTVSLSPAQITFNNTSLNNTLQESTGAPKSGVEVRIFRNTEVDNPKGVFAAGNSVRALDLNNNVDQALYALQEEKDQPLWGVAFEGGTIDGVTIGGTTPAAGTFSNLTISNLDSTIIGANTAAAGTFTTGTIATADINGGAIDGTVIGANTAAAGTFTSGTFTSVNLLDDQKIKLGDAADDDAEIWYSGNVLNIDSEKSIILETGTGSFTVAANGSPRFGWVDSLGGFCDDPFIPYVNNQYDLGTTSSKWKNLRLSGTAYLPTVDIDAGNIDGTTIGSTTAAAGTFTTGTITTADINGGNIDGTTIGGTTAAAGTFTTGSFNDITLTDSSVCNINTNTSDGSDNKALVVCGGGGGSALRGGFVAFYGNESGSAGNLQLGSGRTSTGKVDIYAGPTPTLGLTVDQDGKVVIPTADINGGNIDGTTIGATTAAAGSFTSVNLLDDQKIKLGDAADDDAELYYSGNTLYIDSEKGIIIDTGNGTFSVAVNGTSKFGWTSVLGGFVDDDWLPFANDTHSLGSNALKWKDLKLTGTAYLPTVDIDAGNIDGTTIGATTPVAGTFTTLNLSTTTGQISSNTADGSDNKNLHLCGGGGTNNARGATISLSGNEATNAGNLYLYSGAVTTGEVFIYAGDSSTLGLKVNQHGNVVIPTDLTVQGTLNVTGSTTTINTSTLEVEDKNITLAKVSTPTDTTADGGGITIKGATDKTFNWVDATDSFTSSEHIHLNGDNRKLRLGAASDDVEIYYSGSAFNIDSAGTIVLDAHNGAFSVSCQGVPKLGWSSIAGGVFVGDDILPFGTGQTGQHDIGSSTMQFKDIYIDGVAYLDEVDIDAGAIDGTTIGANTPAAGDFTRVVLTGAPGKLVSNTADGSDNNIVAICGGGDSFTSRGGIISLYGNEVSSTPGDVFISSGQVSTGKIKFHTGSSSTLGLTIDENQKVGIGTSSPTNALDVQGGTSNTAIVARSTDAKAQISLVDNTTTGVGHVVIGAEGDALFLTSGAGVTALTLDSSQNATFAGDITNTGAVTHNFSSGNIQAIFPDGSQVNGVTGLPSQAGTPFVVAKDTGSGRSAAFGGSISFGGAGSYVDSNVLRFSPAGTSYIDHETVGQSILFRTSASSALDTTALTIASDGDATFAKDLLVSAGIKATTNYAGDDNVKLKLGTGDDLTIWHGESNSGNNENANYISCASGRNLIVQVQDDANGIVFHKRTGTGLFNFEALASFTAGGSNSLYYDGSKKFETSSAGVKITGELEFLTASDVNFTGANYHMVWDASASALELKDNTKLICGTGDDLQIFHDSDSSYIEHTTSGTDLIIDAKSPGDDLILRAADDVNIRVQGNETAINCIGGAQVELYHANNVKFRTTSSGAEIRSQEGEDANLFFYADEGDDHADMWLVQAESDGFFALKNYADSSWEISLKATGANNIELYYDNSKKFETLSDGVRVSGYIYANDSNRLCLGDSADLQIYHDGSNSNIKNGTGWLNVYAGGNGFSVGNGDFSENLFKAANNGAVELYYDNVKQCETNSGGMNWADSKRAYFGDSSDLQLYFDGTHSRLVHTPATGDLVIQSDDTYLTNGAGGEYYFRGTQNGAVELYYDNSKKLHTFSGGVKFFGTLEADDNDKIKLGDNADLEIYHDGSHSIIKNSTNSLYAATGAFLVQNAAQTESQIISSENGAVELYYDNVKKFSTTTDGALIHGRGQIGGNISGGWIGDIQNDGNDADRYGLQLRCGADDGSGTNYALGILTGNGTTQGYITFSGGTVTYGAFTAHHPCIVPDSENPSDSSNAYPYGTLLETISIEYTKQDGSDTERGIRYKVQKTQSANSRKVLGAYGSSMNGGPDGQTNEHQALVLGDGHILVNNAGGNIEVGDGICSSAVAGIGQKATANPSMIIGIAQEAITFTGSETKLVAVQYGLQQFIPWS